MSTETQREKFEEWASIDTRIANIDRYEKTDLDDDAPYKNWDTAFAWSVWQAAQSSQAAEIEALRKDAERYRFIRGNNQYVIKVSSETIHCGGHVPVKPEKFGPALDQAIDAAMQTKEAS